MNNNQIEFVFTYADEYTSKYFGEYFDYFQLHVLDAEKIVSQYFDPKEYTLDKIKRKAESLSVQIGKRSNFKDKATLFERAGKFLITESKNFIEPVDFRQFNPELIKYENFENTTWSLFEFIENKDVDQFFKNGLTEVGASDLYPLIEPFTKALRQKQLEILKDHEQMRELNKTNPLVKLEVYKIDSKYNPVLIEEFLYHDYNSALFLPEHEALLKSDERITFILRDIASNKIIEGNLRESIESIKYFEDFNKRPHLIDPGDLMRMELDNDDPDFLSMDNSDFDVEEIADDEE